MKIIKTLLLLCVLGLASCKPDPCLDVICLNYGICDDGACLCADWYEGTDCSTEERAKYYGDYIGTATYFNAAGDEIDSSTDTIPVVANGLIVNEIIADGIPLVLSVSGLGVFVIPPNATSDPNGTSLTVSGDGSFDSNLLTINATMEFAQDTLTFSFTGSK